MRVNDIRNCAYSPSGVRRNRNEIAAGQWWICFDRQGAAGVSPPGPRRPLAAGKIARSMQTIEPGRLALTKAAHLPGLLLASVHCDKARPAPPKA